MQSNYINKPIDLTAWHGVKPDVTVQLSPELFSTDTNSSVCTGMQKLIQKWLSIFLTPKGSVTFDKNRGTDFMIDIFSASTENEVYKIFILSNVDAVAQIRAEENNEAPEDEQIQSVTLTGLSLFLGNLSMDIKIVSKSGENAKIIVPIDTNPLML